MQLLAQWPLVAGPARSSSRLPQTRASGPRRPCSKRHRFIGLRHAQDRSPAGPSAVTDPGSLDASHAAQSAAAEPDAGATSDTMDALLSLASDVDPMDLPPQQGEAWISSSSGEEGRGQAFDLDLSDLLVGQAPRERYPGELLDMQDPLRKYVRPPCAAPLLRGCLPD